MAGRRQAAQLEVHELLNAAWRGLHRRHGSIQAGNPGAFIVIRKLASGQYRLYSRKVDPKTGKRRNLGTFPTREKAEKHEREVQYFKRD
jgi:hypothetical protein